MSLSHLKKAVVEEEIRPGKSGRVRLNLIQRLLG